MKIFSSFTLCLVAFLLLPSQSFIDAKATLSVSAQISEIQDIIKTLKGFVSNTTGCVERETRTSIISYLLGVAANSPNPTVRALLNIQIGNLRGLEVTIGTNPHGCVPGLPSFLNGVIAALKKKINKLQPTTAQQVTTKELTTAAPVPTCDFGGSHEWHYWDGACYGEVQVEGAIGDMVETCLTTGIPDVYPASIHSQEQCNFIEKYVFVSPPDWLGIYYDAEGNLKWFDNSPVDFVRAPLRADQNPSLAGYGIMDDWTAANSTTTFPYALCQAPPLYV